jgi:hypothetical protein
MAQDALSTGADQHRFVGQLPGHLPDGEAQEWFHQNVELFHHQVRDWTLETVIQGLQKRFLDTLTYHHALNKFDAVM